MRVSEVKSSCTMVCCAVSDEMVKKIKADLARETPGLWARENNYKPGCTCGLRRNGYCVRHGGEGTLLKAPTPPQRNKDVL